MPISVLSSLPSLYGGGFANFCEVLLAPFSDKLAPHGRFCHGVGLDEVLQSAP